MKPELPKIQVVQVVISSLEKNFVPGPALDNKANTVPAVNFMLALNMPMEFFCQLFPERAQLAAGREHIDKSNLSQAALLGA